MLEGINQLPPRLRTVFISDIHLGFKGCSADLLLDFLHHVEMDHLFLVGDIIDVWSMQKNMFWPQSHNNVMRTILGKAKRGTKVIFVPGNHDETAPCSSTWKFISTTSMKARAAAACWCCMAMSSTAW